MENDSISLYVQNFEKIGQLKRVLWTNEISRDLSLRLVSDGHPISHNLEKKLNATEKRGSMI